MQLGIMVSPCIGFHPFWEPQSRKGLRERYILMLRKTNYGNPNTHLNNLDYTAKGEGQGDNDEEAGEQCDQKGTKSRSLVASWNIGG